jgi:uncharacterized protein YkwD
MPEEAEAKADIDGEAAKDGKDEQVGKNEKDDEELSPEAKKKAALEEAKKKAAEKKAAKAKPKAGPGPGIAKAKAGGGSPSKKKGGAAGGFSSGGQRSTAGRYAGIGGGGPGGGASAALAGAIGVNLGAALQANQAEMLETDEALEDPTLSPILAQLIREVNVERRKAELPELTINDDLMKMAQDQSDRLAAAHDKSRFMQQWQFLVHDLYGRTFTQRLKEFKYEAEVAGENLSQDALKGVVKVWAEPGARYECTGLLLLPDGREVTEKIWGRPTYTRDVLLNPAYREMGVGFAQSKIHPAVGGVNHVTLVAARRKTTPAIAEMPSASPAETGGSDDESSPSNE